MLYTKERHFLIDAEPWNPDQVFSFVHEVVGKIEEAYSEESLWPTHPLDRANDASPIPMMYFGVGGVAWGLNTLRNMMRTRAKINFSEILKSCIQNQTEGESSYFFGETGLRLALQSIQPSNENYQAFLENIRSLQKSKTNEIMAGAPGALIALQLAWELNKDPHAENIIRELIESTIGEWKLDPETQLHIWRQDYGRLATYLGAAHGAVGNIFSLLRASQHLKPKELEEVQTKAISLLKALALTNDTEANWPTLLPHGERDLLVHWCHGAPGIVMQLADRIPTGLDTQFDQLMVKAGNLIWNAGPLKKGASLCHGTTGSGAALLKLFERTGDEIWLNRARTFAMAAIQQIKEHRDLYQSYRYSLWTGDVGSMQFLISCQEGRFRTPMLDMI